MIRLCAAIPARQPALARRWVPGLLFALLVSLAPSVGADEQSVRPGINRPYQDPNVGVWVERFERPGREVYNRRFVIVDALGLKPGMVVADIGAGTGLFTRLMAPRVAPHGQVIAVDISRKFVDHAVRTAQQAGLGNVSGVVNSARDTGLAAASVDLAFLCDTYHHLEYPRSMLASIRRALRPGGALVVIDFEREPGLSSPWVLGHVRAGKTRVIDEIRRNGFRLVEDRRLLRSNYFLRFEPLTAATPP